MKTRILSALALTLLLTVGAYAQENAAMTKQEKKEMRRQVKAERKARVKIGVEKRRRTH